MAIGDQAGMETLKHFEEVTLPKLESLVERLEKLVNEDANRLLDRINGTRVQMLIPPV